MTILVAKVLFNVKKPFAEKRDKMGKKMAQTLENTEFEPLRMTGLEPAFTCLKMPILSRFLFFHDNL